MIDAAGAIYVIGGVGVGGTYYNDVWKSTDGGVGLAPGVVVGTWWVSTQRVLRVLGCTRGLSRGTRG